MWVEPSAADPGTVKEVSSVPLLSAWPVATMTPAYLIVAAPEGVKPRPVTATLLSLPLESGDRMTESAGEGVAVGAGTMVGVGLAVGTGTGVGVCVGAGGGVAVGAGLEVGVGVGGREVGVGVGAEVGVTVGAGSEVAVGRAAIEVCRRASTVASISGVGARAAFSPAAVIVA
jgi:hypothetical protein